LFGALHLGLFAGGNRGADRFGVAFDGLGGDLQTGQRRQFLPAVVEAALAADQGHHAAHPR